MHPKKAGIWAYSRPSTDLPKSIRFHRVTAVVMGALAVLGMITDTNTLFGYMPLWGHDAAGHGLFALVAAYFGMALSTKSYLRADHNEILANGPSTYRPL